jgi:hypothetical protein
METDYQRDQLTSIENQRLTTSVEGLRVTLESQFASIDSKIDGKLALQTRELVVWIVATAMGTFVCSVGMMSVLLKLSLG